MGKVKDVLGKSFSSLFETLKSIASVVAGPLTSLGKLLIKIFAGIKEALDPLAKIGKTIAARFSGFFQKFSPLFPKGSSVSVPQSMSSQILPSLSARKEESAITNKVVKSLDILVERIEKALAAMAPGPLASMSSGVSVAPKPAIEDVYGTRDPLLGALNSGELDVRG